ncbi:lytic transglycosylase domain-containing protein [Shinella sp. CPCC 101442]|uniref:lytic transglycosylase domain-containing protein n=1 Tax=Shinella sp. CPCC 101442 TaxID=2932265 RepID=UPI002152B73B|nr:lytic transglycosylase domain-containing protein [Shinella sp. CPCC 101442]MCR6498835.1 lytic transglycosylase domain-containing protein [Shinella sp. CPCC 101442]
MISTNSFALCALLLAGIAGLALRSSPVEADSTAEIKPLGFAAEMPSKDVITSAIPRTDSVPTVSAELREGLDALSNRDAASAIAMRDRLPSTSLDRHILTWAIAVSGQRGVPSWEIAGAQRELKGWPGLTVLRANSERAMARENPPAADVLAAFGTTRPETAEGAIVLSRALVATSETPRATDILRSFWQKEALSTDLEDRILAEFGTLLGAADHKMRMEMLLYRDRAEQAQRFGDLGKAQSLYRAWAAVIRKNKTAGDLIKAVDAGWQKDPAYTFLRIRYLRSKEAYRAAGKLFAAMPDDPARLVNPGAWWNEQRIVSRGLADLGDYRDAYRVAAHHGADDPTDIVEAEFHAGWYALRDLGDAKTAARHFQRILQTSDRPLSVSRAWYWLGRAAEKGAPGDAKDYFAKAANFPGTFYGQLAGARLGRKTLNVAYPTPTPEERTSFQQREAVQAITRLQAAGHGWRADSLYRALAGELMSPGELALLAAQAEKGSNHQLSLQIGKIAFGRGIDVAALAFPIGVIPDGANISGSGKALAYAIARQESAFNPAAISPANAQGLLQLMPGTAQGVAKRYGLAYSKERLTTDAAYNATLGAHYLGEQINDFGGSYVLTFIAYNAGPRRVPQWIARYGDPRGKPIDEVVDWVERIPFSETRGYVQRVMENYQVYKTRLGQTADIVHDLSVGR